MTQSSPKNPKLAFTLIELLVVIAIIVVLMGLLFPVVSAVREQGRKVQAKNDITQILNAVKAYYTEYGKYPVDPSTIAGTTDMSFGQHPTNGGGNNCVVIDVLRNNISPTLSASGTTVAALNPRQIVFLEAPSVKDESAPKAGVSTTSSAGVVGIWYDPWGTQYNLALDVNYDNQIDKLVHGYNDTNFSTINTGILLWSYGKDKVQGGKSSANVYAGSDDVISWQ